MSSGPQRPGITPAKGDNQSSQSDVAALMQTISQLAAQVADLQGARARAGVRMTAGEAMEIAEQRMAEQRAKANEGKYAYKLSVRYFKQPMTVRVNSTDPSVAVMEIERKLGTRFDPQLMKLEQIGASE